MSRPRERRRIAIVGTGISGLMAAWRLHRAHDITVFEAADWIGGHTHTVDVEVDGERHAVDTGFIVFNEANYPHFSAMLRHFGVATQPSDMSFSVSCERTGLEYNGTSLNKLFAQRSNLLRPSFHRMIREILRFNRETRELIGSGDPTLELGVYLDRLGYSRELVDNYIVPMGSALWSAPPGRILEFPVRYFVEFFHNHGFLDVHGRPQWKVVTGGSARYVEALTSPFRDRIHLRTAVESIRRVRGRVAVAVKGGPTEIFDEVVIATHSDQALRLLGDPTDKEREILGAIRYQSNEVILHTDAGLLPRRRLARASWNYRIPREPGDSVTVTYYMNLLQDLRTRIPFCVSLNSGDRIDPSRVLARFTYDHPQFTPASFAAQQRRDEINGQRGIWYCGAYWGYGFHEDGVRSGLEVARALGGRGEAAA